MTKKERRLRNLRLNVELCPVAGSGIACKGCDNSSAEIRRLESELGTVAPEHRAFRSGALAR